MVAAFIPTPLVYGGKEEVIKARRTAIIVPHE